MRNCSGENITHINQATLFTIFSRKIYIDAGELLQGNNIYEKRQKLFAKSTEYNGYNMSLIYCFMHASFRKFLSDLIALVSKCVFIYYGSQIVVHSQFKAIS